MNELETVRHRTCGTPLAYERRAFASVVMFKSRPFANTQQRSILWCYTCDREVEPIEVDPPGAVCLVANGE